MYTMNIYMCVYITVYMYIYIYYVHLYVYEMSHCICNMKFFHLSSNRINPKKNAKTQTFVSLDASQRVAAVGSVRKRVMHIKAAWQRNKERAIRKMKRWFFQMLQRGKLKLKQLFLKFLENV